MHHHRIIGALFLILVLAWMLPGFASAASSPPLPQDPLAGLAPMSCGEDGLQSSGAVYRICMPTNWNGDLLVYAHGYVSPLEAVAIPESQLVVGGVSLADVANMLGYAFAVTSYSVNGLAVRPALDDVLELVDIFEQQQGKPGRVLLAGVSEGGLIATLLTEQRPDVFDGGLALCGPYGDFGDQIEHFGDGRVIFDYFFPGLLPASPVQIPNWLIDDWDTVYNETILPVLEDPSRSDDLAQWLAVTGVAFDPGDESTRVASAERMLWYNIFATNDASGKLGGQPFDNLARRYSGSSDDEALNQAVARFVADEAAEAEMEAHYLTSGKLSVPLVIMHTTGDPIVPYWHVQRYEAKVLAADNLALQETITIERYGHCQFTLFELLNAFRLLRAMVDDPPSYRAPYSLFLPALRSEPTSAN